VIAARYAETFDPQFKRHWMVAVFVAPGEFSTVAVVIATVV
jgi:hypothetical protein